MVSPRPGPTARARFLCRPGSPRALQISPSTQTVSPVCAGSRRLPAARKLGLRRRCGSHWEQRAPLSQAGRGEAESISCCAAESGGDVTAFILPRVSAERGQSSATSRASSQDSRLLPDPQRLRDLRARRSPPGRALVMPRRGCSSFRGKSSVITGGSPSCTPVFPSARKRHAFPGARKTYFP